MLDEKCKELAALICNYRSGEISQINAAHVEKWISQFDENVQKPILEEMQFVFSKWYFTHDYIVNEYLDKIPGIMQTKYGFSSEYEACKNISYVDFQSEGQSQHKLISELKRLKKEQYDVSIITGIDHLISHYAYIDDGFYSGSRARKDLKELAYLMKPGDTLDVFYLVICTSSFLYAKNEFKQLEKECKIRISFHPLKKIDNDRWEHTEYKDGTETVWWMTNQMCLWPSKESGADPEVNAYFDYLKTLSSKYEKYPYRCSHWINDSGIFSSAERRALVEHEFLKKGIQLTKSYQGNKKGVYPLGYNLWPSFGFGLLFATDYNVPNNTPLVIWSETNWYPLLPRRSNAQSDLINAEDAIDFEEIDYHRDQYNMCPDCGKFFGLDEDGGNGFCIDCAWNH